MILELGPHRYDVGGRALVMGMLNPAGVSAVDLVDRRDRRRLFGRADSGLRDLRLVADATGAVGPSHGCRVLRVHDVGYGQQRANPRAETPRVGDAGRPARGVA